MGLTWQSEGEAKALTKTLAPSCYIVDGTIC